ncbi:carbohydrate kinase family protein [Streptomyces sp. NBC_00286]|uniref:carbohydrate kinase family protein n=1 Tax=Streptomyces sp. NBC_00286 TaxID=2975701 RepID=UPI002E29D32B|nr:carbohydrate kinase family protein [Streptomyces sp. NBC_00286]
MRIAVTGSIATDHLMTFPGRITELLIPDRLHTLSLSFLVDSLEMRRGGAAANIAFGLGLLGLDPLLVGAVGGDFADYEIWLKEHGVDTSGVRVSTRQPTARFVCMTDQDSNQIASFHPGAMAEARDIDLRQLLTGDQDIGLVVVSPDDPEAMRLHTEQCRELGVPFAADPSRQLALLTGAEVRDLVHGARWLFTNEYESALLLKRTGWCGQEVLDRVGAWVTTLGPGGVRIESADGRSTTVPTVPGVPVADPTGVGDAFRAGFLAACGWGHPPAVAARLGCVLAAESLGGLGSQDYELTPRRLLTTLASAYDHRTAQGLVRDLRHVGRTRTTDDRRGMADARRASAVATSS